MTYYSEKLGKAYSSLADLARDEMNFSETEEEKEDVDILLYQCLRIDY